MIKIIHDMYRDRKITYEELNHLTKLKIEFLYYNFDKLSLFEKQDAEDILNEHEKLLIQGSYSQIINPLHKSADIIQ